MTDQPLPAIMCVSCGGTRLATEPPCTCRVRTPQPWEAGTIPTPIQLLAWVRAATDDEVLLLLDGALASSEVAHRCMTADHDHGMRELNTLRADATRWAILRDTYREFPPDLPSTRHIAIAAKAIELIEESQA